jgi:hypothetical protein
LKFSLAGRTPEPDEQHQNEQYLPDGEPAEALAPHHPLHHPGNGHQELEPESLKAHSHEKVFEIVSLK